MTVIPHFLDGLPDRWPQTPCRDHPELFVVSKGVTPAAEDTAKAKWVCSGCPVREACGDYAIANGFRDGIWGGLTVDERDELVQERLAASQAASHDPEPVIEE